MMMVWTDAAEAGILERIECDRGHLKRTAGLHEGARGIH